MDTCICLLKSVNKGGEYFLCSDAAAIIQYTPDVIYLADNQIVTLIPGREVVSSYMYYACSSYLASFVRLLLMARLFSSTYST